MSSDSEKFFKTVNEYWEREKEIKSVEDAMFEINTENPMLSLDLQKKFLEEIKNGICITPVDNEKDYWSYDQFLQACPDYTADYWDRWMDWAYAMIKKAKKYQCYGLTFDGIKNVYYRTRLERKMNREQNI